MKKEFTNPFEALEDNHSRSFSAGPGRRKVQAGIDSHLGTARMLGSFADVYLSRFVETVMGMAGSRSDRNATDSESQNPRTEGPSSRKKAHYPNQTKK